MFRKLIFHIVETGLEYSVPSIYSSWRIGLDLSRTQAPLSRHDLVTSVLTHLGLQDASLAGARESRSSPTARRTQAFSETLFPMAYMHISESKQQELEQQFGLVHKEKIGTKRIAEYYRQLGELKRRYL